MRELYSDSEPANTLSYPESFEVAAWMLGSVEQGEADQPHRARINALLRAAGRADLQLEERVLIKEVTSQKDLAGTNNFVPRLSNMFPASYDNQLPDGVTFSDLMSAYQAFLQHPACYRSGERSQSAEELLETLRFETDEQMGALRLLDFKSEEEMKDPAIYNFHYPRGRSVVLTHIVRPAFWRMWILFPKTTQHITEHLAAHDTTPLWIRHQEEGIRPSAEELARLTPSWKVGALAYNIMSRLVDKRDTDAEKVNDVDWYLKA